jgi:hypothetical protein
VGLVDQDALRRHRLAIQADSEGPYVWGVTDQLWLALHIERQADVEDGFSQPFRHWTAVTNRLTDLRTIALKLDWMLSTFRGGELDRFAWMYYAASDVVAFLTSTRSLLDHVAAALLSVAPHRASLPRPVLQRTADMAAKASGASGLARRVGLGSGPGVFVVRRGEGSA